MLNISSISKGRKRLGRGYGSGKGGHTTGRGQKGQKARYKVGILFEGVKNKKSLLHRLPILPGKGKFKAGPKPVSISISKLNSLPSGEITMKVLVSNGLVSKKDISRGAKVLGIGKVTKKFDLKISASASVVTAIVEAGGTIL